MASFFKNYKKVDYDFPINGTVETHSVTNLSLRTIIREVVREKTASYYKYFWKEGDRPDIVADRYYGSPQYWWVVLYSNDAFDLYYDFPRDSAEFIRYLDEKYEAEAIAGAYASGSLYARQEVKFVRDPDGNIIVNGGFANVSLVTGPDFNPTGLTEVTFYEWEEEENEAKREINLLDNRLLQQFVSEFEQKMREREG